jgi:predicted dinucleotide-binding enzyme
MRVGIIGRGRMGSGLAQHLERLGHDVAGAGSDGPDVTDGADVVLLAVPYGAVEAVAEGGSWDGRLVVDLTNFYADRDGAALDPAPGASSVVVAGLLPGARVVKAFNTIRWDHLAEQAGRDPRRAIPVAADDAAAKDAVMRLVEAIGFVAVDAGTLADSTAQQPGTPVYNADLDEAGALEALAAAR